MTALAARPATTPHLPGMVWVTWRLHRGAVAGVVAVLGALSLLLLVMGLRMHHDYDSLGVAACLKSASCQIPYETFRDRYNGWISLLPQYLTFLPGVVGVFVGGPLVAREYESGTFRFVWTQGTSRVRWIAAKLSLLLTVLLLLGLGFSLVFSWWYGPWTALRGRMEPGGAYETAGVMFAARVVFAFSLAAFVGTLLRRPVAAMATAGVVWVVTVFVAVTQLRPLIETPLQVPDSTFQRIQGGWQLHTWTQDAAGHHVSNATLSAVIKAAGVGRDAVPDWLSRHGYAMWDSYQPESRFWHFQLVEGGAYLLVSLALAAAVVGVLRRRAA